MADQTQQNSGTGRRANSQTENRPGRTGYEGPYDGVTIVPSDAPSTLPEDPTAPVSARTCITCGTFLAAYEESCPKCDSSKRSTRSLPLFIALCAVSVVVGVTVLNPRTSSTGNSSLALKSKQTNSVGSGSLPVLLPKVALNDTQMGELAAAASRGDTGALKQLSDLAIRGNHNAQFELGNIYLTETGTLKDNSTARKWLNESANQGNVKAQNAMGLLSELSAGDPANLNDAVSWYTKAAEKGFALAQGNLGSMYLSGRGVSKDPVKAIEWYTKAAEQGLVMAQTNLGSIYAHGNGVPKNYEAAAFWLKKAAEKGDPKAASALGALYANGMGVAQDPQMAIFWTNKAAEQGDAVAQYNLGMMYSRGTGTKQELELSQMWLKRAAASGHEGAKAALESSGQ
jgi:TPR repeat protein